MLEKKKQHKSCKNKANFVLEESVEDGRILLGTDVLSNLFLVKSRVLTQKRRYFHRIEWFCEQAVLLEESNSVLGFDIEEFCAVVVQLLLVSPLE